MNLSRFIPIIGFLFSALVAEAYTPTEDGLYAQFDTSEGEFTCQLAYDKVPLTVANFVGLAEGTIAWYDYEKNKISHEPFYDGITFHRIIANTLIQGGSRNGEGTDGPGYSFPDDLRSDLLHSEAGVLSMAHSSSRNSNGSQFFITLTSMSYLDYVHSVFGKVVNGLSVVTSISNGAVDGSDPDDPLFPVTINHVTIIRVGSDAENFDPLAYPLDKLTRLPNGFIEEAPRVEEDEEVEEGVVVLKYTFQPVSFLRNMWAMESDDMLTWSNIAATELEIDDDGHIKVEISDEKIEDGVHFFKAIARTTHDPNGWAAKEITFDYVGDFNNISFGMMEDNYMRINPDLGGAYGNYTWEPLGNNRFQLFIYYPNYFNYHYYLTLDQGSETQGSFFLINMDDVAHQYTPAPYAQGYHGRFTLAPYDGTLPEPEE